MARNIDYEDISLIHARRIEDSAQASLIKWQVTTEDILQHFELIFQDFYFDTQLGKFTKVLNENYATMNLLGANKVMSYLRQIINKNTILSTKTEAEVKTALYDLGMQFCDFLSINAVLFDLSPSNQALIMVTIDENLHSTYKRAHDEYNRLGGEKRYLGKIQSYEESQTRAPEDNLQKPL